MRSLFVKAAKAINNIPAFPSLTEFQAKVCKFNRQQIHTLTAEPVPAAPAVVRPSRSTLAGRLDKFERMTNA